MARTDLKLYDSVVLTSKDGQAGVLHDVCNALTVILGWAVAARGPEASAELVARALAIVERRARETREVARKAMGAGATGWDDDATVGQVLGDVVEGLGIEAELRQLRFFVEPSEALALHAVERSLLAQGVTNLLLNALAFAPLGSEVRIELGMGPGMGAGERLRIDVVDSGPGVEPSRARTIFEGDSRRVGGSGIGLGRARDVARRVGGDLELVVVEPAAIGARFRLTWPVRAARGQTLAGKRVVVLEDDADVAELLVLGLEARGAEVRVVSARTELLEGSGYDAALLDLSPLASGASGASGDAMQFVEGLRQRGARVVFISGHEPTLGFGDRYRWVRKPFEIGQIVEALTESERGAGRNS